MSQILQANKAVNIEVIDEIFFLDFKSIVDRRHATWDGPWSFYKDLIVFKAPYAYKIQHT